jgi:ribosomal-protein-alanine N-acetyltransferase
MTAPIPVTVVHAAVLAGLHRTAFAGDAVWPEAAIATLLAQPGVFGLAAAADGFVLGRVAADEAEILTLAVAPRSRGRGVGTSLMHAAMAHARTAGAAGLLLEVASNNAAALALYGRLGFARVGLRRRYYPDGGDALVLRVDLPVDLTPGGAISGLSHPAAPRSSGSRDPAPQPCEGH